MFFEFYIIDSWLSYDWEDNSNVLRWLAETLSEAESAGDKVHIISHIPPGNNDCLGAWGRNYARIIERQVIMSTKDFFLPVVRFLCFSTFLGKC